MPHGSAETVDKSLAMGYIDTVHLEKGETYHVHLVGEKRSARILTEPAIDPAGARMRS